VERALFLYRLENPLPQGYSRLYFGAEFCPWMFPRTPALRQALQGTRREGWHFTLATPVIYEAFLPVLRQSLVEFLPLLEDGDEVLVSDLGAIALVRDIAPHLPIVLGRALSGQKRGPRVLDLDLNTAQLDYFRRGSWYAGETAGLLAELGIGRVELDNLLQGTAPLPAGLAGSLHYPYAMVTSSRNCPFRAGSGAEGCCAPCGDVFTLTTTQHRVPLLQGGNTQFLRNDHLPENPAALGVDRLVFHPLLPR